ncbi:asparagine synthase [Stanieria cyanosphaera PCC 7437]|uniref:asparagine synthase (glutamine-hydrolyzing) n=1 Tax=Stanieria cyanosphaera (strain ATCC 29371 / PCC 7437) TaxID=111780 RepID=K9XPY9_STAC7|nr:asparagine synthase-related protein [Stanieria cyanosphaera]AFZ34578.1 asparagine synthase [Stanieria cyanosphaera PCC 7437]
MSGILGVWNSRKPTPWQKMLADLEVLGKDGRGDWHNSEINLSLGRTQFFNTPESCLEAPVIEYEGCVLVWDGRVDDRESLLADRSKVTDAQLIIESYRRWGVDCIKYLIGDFVFILWDASQDLLFVGCDALGRRTLAYYWDGQTLLLASRVLTLLLHPQVSRELDEVYVAHTICGSLAHPPGITAFKDLKRLLPGQALVLQSEQLQLQQIYQLTQPKSYLSPQSPEDCYEKFWYLLNKVVKDYLRSCRQPYTTLSGGLDSSTVTVSLLNHLPKVDAFSVTTDIYPEFDEREPIKAFLQRYPQVNWHPINCNDAWAFSEPWDKLPVVDDPFITCALPMNLRTMDLAKNQGFGLAFSGVWGDEFCYTLWADQMKAGNWKLFWQHFQESPRWYSWLWRQFFLPSLPASWQARWIALRLSSSKYNLPQWLNSNYAQSSQIHLAIQQRFQSSLVNSRVSAICQSLENTSSVGMNQLYKLLAATYQIEPVAPIGDRRMIEFANSIHPSLQIDNNYEKIFLRQANRETLPDRVRLRPKENYFDPLKYAGLGKGKQPLAIVAQAKENSYLASIIDFIQLEDSLNQYRKMYQQNYAPWQDVENKLSNQLLTSLTFCDWWLRVEKHYFN